MRTPFHCAFVSALLLAGCTGDITGGLDEDGDGEPDFVCEQARTYVGFGGEALEADRAKIEAGSDRMRLKPFSALATEYARALGLESFDTRVYAATFGRPPARWYGEPQASANTVYAAFALAFSACSQHTATGEGYASAPTPQVAASVCRDLALRAWHREASDDEVAACVTYAVDQTDPADDPRRRWAYSCASVLSASGFLAY